MYYSCFGGEGGKEYLIVLQSHVVFVDVERGKVLWSMTME